VAGLPEPTDVSALAVALDGSVVGDVGRPEPLRPGAWRQFRGAGAPPQRPIVALAAGPEGALWVAWSNGLAFYGRRLGRVGARAAFPDCQPD
jgi:hypothetical protein